MPATTDAEQMALEMLELALRHESEEVASDMASWAFEQALRHEGILPSAKAWYRYARGEAGRFGQKTGAGFYRYELGSRTPLPDPALDAVFAAEAVRQDVRRRQISAAERKQDADPEPVRLAVRQSDDGPAVEQRPDLPNHRLC